MSKVKSSFPELRVLAFALRTMAWECRTRTFPNLLGRVLSGTKYGVKQTRGKFGLGAKMALIWSKMSTGLPIEIHSARKGQSFVSYYKLDIDIHK